MAVLSDIKWLRILFCGFMIEVAIWLLRVCLVSLAYYDTHGGPAWAESAIYMGIYAELFGTPIFSTLFGFFSVLKNTRFFLLTGLGVAIVSMVTIFLIRLITNLVYGIPISEAFVVPTLFIPVVAERAVCPLLGAGVGYLVQRLIEIFRKEELSNRNI